MKKPKHKPSRLGPGAEALRVVRKFFPSVTSVVDSDHNMTIEVTKGDAASKAVKNHNACAMAVACKRKFHLDGVIISRTKAYLVKDGVATRFDLPESVSREVVSFDRGSGFEPGEYELAKIAPSNRFGIRPLRTDERKRGNGSPKRLHHVTAKIRSVLGGKKPEGE